ncbi:MAG: HD domain-containing protein [Clostridiales bacterium]|nr:HD domain-containing protein [Clostridiales bacterium]
MNGSFKGHAMVPGNPKYESAIVRYGELSQKPDDVRTPFERDYTRILHSRAYSRLKNKTQVFFATQNDHICTRIEHVNHVSSISVAICKHLGLNEELALAIATGHDLGHAPFGHSGEKYINQIISRHIDRDFGHEKNSLRIIDKYETLQNSKGFEQNLNLTYAVRDGIVSHCGEVEDEYLVPRDEILLLESIEKPNENSPYTWEGCVVKIADNIAYVGRDIEDALRLNILDGAHEHILKDLLKDYVNIDIKKTNNTSLIYHLVTNLCSQSSPEYGLHYSEDHLKFLRAIKDFNYKYIYGNERLIVFHDYAHLILESIFNMVLNFYKGPDTIDYIKSHYLSIYPELSSTFINKLEKYSDLGGLTVRNPRFKNKVIYQLENRYDFIVAIIDYLSSMTDHFAIKIFDELTTF